MSCIKLVASLCKRFVDKHLYVAVIAIAGALMISSIPAPYTIPTLYICNKCDNILEQIYFSCKYSCFASYRALVAIATQVKHLSTMYLHTYIRVYICIYGQINNFSSFHNKYAQLVITTITTFYAQT